MCIRAVSPWSRCHTRIATLAALAVVALFALAGSAQAAAPSNDDFANAITLAGASGSQSGSTLEATVQTGEPSNHQAELEQPNDLGAASVWYEWTAPASGLVGFQTEDPGTDYDTTLGIYTGSLGSLSEVDFNDDYGSTTRQSRVVFNATAGQTYKIGVGGYSDHSGAFTLKWGAATRPANDAFASAIPIAGSSGTQAGSNFDASDEPGEPKNRFPVSDLGADSVWYTWTAPTSGHYAFTAPGTPWNENPDEPFDAVIGAYTGDLSGLTEVGFGLRTLGFQATAGTTYAIGVGGEQGDVLTHAYWGDMGSFTLTWAEDNLAPETTITSSSGGRHSITYAFTGSDNHSSSANLRFECKLDSGAFASCTNPKTFSPIAGGLHTVQVRAIDEAGNVDPTPAVKQIRAKGGAKAAAATAARAKKKGHSAKRKSHLKKKAYRLSSRRYG